METAGLMNGDDNNNKAGYITLKVTCQEGSEMFFRIKKTTQLKKLLTTYCDRQVFDFKTVVFLYDGSRILPDHTPSELEMEDGDEIEAFLHQIGGMAFYFAGGL